MQQNLRLAAVVMARSGSTAILQRALSSISCLVDVIVLVPNEGSEVLDLNEMLEVMPCQTAFQQHNVTWSDSLSKAHNAALITAGMEAGATWALIMEDSEELEISGNPDQVKLSIQDSSYDVLHCYDKHNMPYTKPRFFQLPATGAFSGPAHSLYITSNSSPPSKDQVLQGVSFLLQPDADQQVLWEQDLHLMLRYNETASLDARGCLHLGDTYEQLKRFDEAVASYSQSAMLSSDFELAAWALYRQASLSRKGNVEDAIQHSTEPAMDPRVQLLGQAMVQYPTMAELPWLASYYAFWQRRYGDAVRLAELAVQLGCYKGYCSARDRRQYVDLRAQYEAPYDVLRYAYKQLGLQQKAEEAGAAYEQALLLRESQAPQPRMGLYQAWHRQGLFDGMPHVFWVNMDRSLERRSHMEGMLNRLNISHTRVRALDSKDPAAAEKLIFRATQGSDCKDDKCREEARINQFCVGSHMMALVTYLNTSTEPYALVAEDDLDVEAYSMYWEKSFGEYFADIPADWAIAQVSTIVIPGEEVWWKDFLRGLVVNGWAKHRWGPYWLGAGAYIVKRETAELMVNRYVRSDGVIDLNQGRWDAYTDWIMYGDHQMYTLPLVSTILTEASTVHDHHMAWHINSKRKLRWLWAQSQWYR